MRFEVSGPCSFEIRPMNEAGEFELSFEVANNVYVDKYKLKHGEDALKVPRAKSIPRRAFSR